MRSLPFLLLFCLCCSLVNAQYSDSTAHYFRLSASGNLNRSNSATAYLLTNDARFGVRSKRTVFNAAANWVYGEQGSALTNNDFIGTADFNWYRDSSKLYYWVLENYTASFSLRIRNQAQTGAGAAYNFVNVANAWLNLSDGILYETSSLTTDAADADHYQTFRNSFRLSYKFIIHKTITLNGANFLQQSLSHGSDYIIRTSNSLAVKLNSWISIGATISYNQFRRTGRENLLFTYGLLAEKYF